jgi:hypothetical protein
MPALDPMGQQRPAGRGVRVRALSQPQHGLGALPLNPHCRQHEGFAAVHPSSKGSRALQWSYPVSVDSIGLGCSMV